MKKIFIDPGHGGDSIGASYKGRVEQDDCLNLALAVKKLLQTQKGVEVMLSRETSVNPSLSNRCIQANNWGADYFLSIHRNAFQPNKATGVENWVYSKVSKQGDTYKKAETILNYVCDATGFKNRGMKMGAPSYTDFAVNRETNMSSCLLELGFIDSDTDNAIFDKKFNEMAKSLAIGLMEAVGETWSETTPDEDTTNSKMLYLVQIGAYESKKSAEELKEQAIKAGFKDAFIRLSGDFDGDGKVTAADAQKVLSKSVE